MAKQREIGQQVYMERRAMDFLKAWPAVPETLWPVYSRLSDAGLLWADPNVDPETDLYGNSIWPGSLRLTDAGEILKQLLDSQSYNMFSETVIVEIRNALRPDTGYKQDLKHRHAAFQDLWKDQLPKFSGPTWPTGMPGGPSLGIASAIRELKLALAENRKARRGK